MSLNGNDTFSSPQGLSHSPRDKAGISPFSASTTTTPDTPLSQEQRRQKLATGPIPDTPNDIRDRRMGKHQNIGSPNNPDSKDWLVVDAQAKFYQEKFDDQKEKYQAKIKDLEQEITRLTTKQISPEYVAGLQADNDGLWAANETLSAQFEALKIENKKLDHSNARQRREIDLIRRECISNGAAIQTVAVDQQEQFDATVRQLKQQLVAAQEDNTELYDKCAVLQQDNDILRATNNGGNPALSANPNMTSPDKDRQLDEQRRIIEESKEKISRQEIQIEELRETVKGQEDQIEDWMSERAYGSTPNLGSELDAAEVLRLSISSEKELELFLKGEPGELEYMEGHPDATIAGGANPESPTSLTRAKLSKLEQDSDKPKSELGFFRGLFTNLFDGLDENSKDSILPIKAKHRSVRKGKSIKDPQITDGSIRNPPFSLRVWMEMISLGRTYWVEKTTRDCTEWVEISGPRWWSLIIQLLGLMLICSLSVTYWCIMKASAERELWLDANEVTMKKYWDTAVWGVERGVLWRLHYGLGLV